ncbi:MAG: C39 family peptidase [Chloroflexota bacterium]
MQVDCHQGTLDNLYDALTKNVPAIVPVQTAELPYWNHTPNQHAVVLVGMDAQFVYLNDPAFHIPALRVPIGDFDLAWLGQGEQYAVLSL